MTLYTEIPIILAIFCLGIGAAISLLVYRKSSRDIDLEKGQWIILLSLRALYISLIAFLILSPFVGWDSTRQERSKLIIAYDNTQSVGLLSDSVRLKQFKAELAAQIVELTSSYDVEQYQFSNSIERIDGVDGVDGVDNSHTYSDYNKSLEEIRSEQANSRVGALLLIGDGTYNQGISPVGVARRMAYPIHTIALGDTTHYADLNLISADAPGEIALKSKLPVDINCRFDDYAGSTATINVKRKSTLLHSERVVVKSDEQYYHKLLFIENDTVGLQKLNVEIVAYGDERNKANNKRELIYRVVKHQKKIGLFAAGPHPDLGKLKKMIVQNPNYEVELIRYKGDSELQKKIDLAVVYQPTTIEKRERLLSSLRSRDVPICYWLGTGTDISSFNRLETPFKLKGENGQTEEVLPVLNQSFRLFETDDRWNNVDSRFPPLIAPFAEIDVAGRKEVLMFQTIKDVETTTPLVVFTKEAKQKSALIAGEGLWRWCLHDYNQNGDNEFMASMVNSCVAYLLSDDRRERFIVKYSNEGFSSSPYMITAQVLNANGQLINDAVVTVKIRSKNKELELNASFSNDQYSVDAGNLPVGAYQFEIEAVAGELEYRKSGEFMILEQNPEQKATMADYNLMLQLSAVSGGDVIKQSDFKNLVANIQNSLDKTNTRTIKNNIWLPELKLLAILLLMLLSVEWFLRKFWGIY